MAAGVIDADATLIPDQAEVWVALKSEVTDIATMIPSSVTADLAALGWEHTGLVDDQKGIALDPTIEVKEYNAFGHPIFRTKLRNGKLVTSFTALEINSVTRKIVLPGSAENKIGRPKDVQAYVLYRFVDEDRSTAWVQLRPAAMELSGHGGIVDGELSWAEITVHHTADAAGDIFEVVNDSTDDVAKTVTIPGGVSAYTFTAGADTTTSIVPKTAAALQTALRALASVQALPDPGATVTGPDGGPLVVTFTGPITPTSATGTGGTVVVS